MATTAVLGAAAERGLARPGITLASLVPTQLQRLLDAGATPGPDLRRILLGGGPMPRALLAARPRGRASRSARATGSPRPARRSRSPSPATSRPRAAPLPGVGVAIADDGEILVSGATVNALGGVRTGDLGRLDERGRLIVTGRKGDMIITGGENVAPAEVEAVLAEHPAVAEAAVFARPHPIWGEAVTALVVAARRAPSRTPPRSALALPRAARAVQGPEGVRAGRRAAAHGVGQGAARRPALASAPVALPDDFRSESRKRWGEQAEGWASQRDALRTRTMPVSAWMIDAIDPQPGQSLLELAAGTGDTGLLAAELIAPGGDADLLGLRARDAGRPRSGAPRSSGSTTCASSRSTPTRASTSRPASIDGVLCRWGYMLMADPENALRETRRVLRAGRARRARRLGRRRRTNPWSALPGRELTAARARRARPTRTRPASSAGRARA